MINKNELVVNELIDEENTIVQKRIVVGEYINGKGVCKVCIYLLL